MNLFGKSEVVENVVFQSLCNCCPFHVFGCYQPRITSKTVSAAQDVVVSLRAWSDFAKKIKIDNVERRRAPRGKDELLLRLYFVMGPVGLSLTREAVCQHNAYLLRWLW